MKTYVALYVCSSIIYNEHIGFLSFGDKISTDSVRRRYRVSIRFGSKVDESCLCFIDLGNMDGCNENGKRFNG